MYLHLIDEWMMDDGHNGWATRNEPTNVMDQHGTQHGQLHICDVAGLGWIGLDWAGLLEHVTLVGMNGQFVTLIRG